MSNNIQSALATAVLTLLRPLVRILLRNGIPYGAFAELAKKVYVDVADAEFHEPGKKQTVSRISALTGLTRKEAKRLRELDSAVETASNERYNRAVRVISGWVNDAAYHDSKGQPAALAIEGREPSFASLVKRYSGDVPTQAMLAVLETAGSVKRVAENIELIRHAYVPGHDPVDKIAILGTDAAELMSTIDHNLSASQDGLRYQRKVSHTAVDPAVIPEFQALSSAKAQQLLEELDDWLVKHENTEGTAAQDTRYVSLGIYYFERQGSEGVDDE